MTLRSCRSFLSIQRFHVTRRGSIRQGVALLDAVIHHGGDQVVRRSDGVHVAGEMQVDILHRNDLRIAAAGRAAFHAETPGEGRLAQREAGVIALQPQRVGQTDGNGGLALPAGVGLMAVTSTSLPLLREILQRDVIDLRLVAAVRFEHFLGDVELVGTPVVELHDITRLYSGFQTE